jgi:hypothetical protein
MPAPSSAPKPGRYRHYKGNEYLVVAVARHTETEEQLGGYRPLYGDTTAWWGRPRARFVEEIEHNGARQPRFAYISPS